MAPKIKIIKFGFGCKIVAVPRDKITSDEIPGLRHRIQFKHLWLCSLKCTSPALCGLGGALELSGSRVWIFFLFARLRRAKFEGVGLESNVERRKGLESVER